MAKETEEEGEIEVTEYNPHFDELLESYNNLLEDSRKVVEKYSELKVSHSKVLKAFGKMKIEKEALEEKFKLIEEESGLGFEVESSGTKRNKEVSIGVNDDIPEGIIIQTPPQTEQEPVEEFQHETAFQEAEPSNSSLPESPEEPVSSNPNSLWSKTIYHYLLPSCKSFSTTGKAIRKGISLIQSNSSIIVHNGKNTSLWFDNWFNNSPFRSLISGPLNREEDSFTVNRVANDLGAWSWEAFFYLPHYIKNLITAIPCFTDSTVEDVTSCSFQKNGSLNLKLIYQYLITDHLNTKSRFSPLNCNWIWKTRCHRRLKFFLWTCANNGLPTKDRLSKRKVNINPYCSFCGASVESDCHLFLECSLTKSIWHLTKCKIILDNRDNFGMWIRDNCTNLDLDSLGIPHSSLFIYSLWQIWVARNNCIFNNKPPSPLGIARKSIAAAAEFQHIAFSSASPDLRNSCTLSVKWTPPLKGWWKLNCDGACLHNPGPFSVGGIRVAISLNCSHLWIETDSSARQNFSEVKLSHTFREGNHCADQLAKLALLNREAYKVYQDLPSFLMPSFLADLHGVTFDRITTICNPLISNSMYSQPCNVVSFSDSFRT
ncbi:reverse transcriptase [Senna tora]|uniref:Reverse transcriptase n=1 Tax=Senna tora TaxID=362788 RepID=A0A834X0P3_9FABA|nr:reverse transcriptase [Senna tora]